MCLRLSRKVQILITGFSFTPFGEKNLFSAVIYLGGADKCIHSKLWRKTNKVFCLRGKQIIKSLRAA